MLLSTTDNFISCNQTHLYHPQLCPHLKQRWATAADHVMLTFFSVTVDNTKNILLITVLQANPQRLPRAEGAVWEVGMEV